ncbi:MAG TPA: HEAT repeat domain-containing protein [candidate division Zixibacteria bacterium]|nr:HEAT repeat domain-containing protein [candidate division Zixibacteria bacterium]
MKRIAIALTLCAALAPVSEVRAQDKSIAELVDSLFVIASSGELKYRDSVERAQQALAALGAEAVPRLIDKLTTPDARERLTVIRIIEKIGAPAVPHLRTALSTKTNALQLKRICWAIGDLKTDGRPALPELMTAGAHSDWQVREYALRGIGKVADSAGSVAPLAAQVALLRSALSDPVAQVRKSACWAAGELGAAELVAPLALALADDFYGARLNAARSLVAIGAPSAATLREYVSSHADFSGDLACQTLGDLTAAHSDSETIAALNRQLQSDRPERRAAAARALGVCATALEGGELSLLRLTERDPYVIQTLDSALARIAARTAD